MSQLETAMAMIIKVFDQYSGAEGNNQTLTKGELKSLMDAELPNFLKSINDKDAVDKILKDLDDNGDSEVDFKEFIIFVAALTCACHNYFAQKGSGK
ncbi:protein S100-P-like [Polypterus senegalus]|uniref:protein S100-P-like n=1 Tax=Polypterus senegalus TaxID=55291 RepID=UPI001963C95C|nr:protein S100-P-like [Polypterus senegalus]